MGRVAQARRHRRHLGGGAPHPRVDGLCGRRGPAARGRALRGAAGAARIRAPRPIDGTRRAASSVDCGRLGERHRGRQCRRGRRLGDDALGGSRPVHRDRLRRRRPRAPGLGGQLHVEDGDRGLHHRPCDQHHHRPARRPARDRGRRRQRASRSSGTSSARSATGTRRPWSSAPSVWRSSSDWSDS